MTYRAEVDILLHFHSISTLLFQNQGLLKFRSFLFYTDQSNQQLHCHPFCLFKPSSFSFCQTCSPSYLDASCQAYYSPSIMISYQPDDYLIEQACLFKAFIPVSRLDEVELFCVVELLYCPDLAERDTSVYEIMGGFECRVKRASRLAEYLPIMFDEYQGCMVKATYHATVLEFRFLREVGDRKDSYKDFWQYLQATTNGFQKELLCKFYSYYRNRIDEEFAALQDMFAQLRKVAGFLKNMRLENELDWMSSSKSANYNQEKVQKIIQGIIQEFSALKEVCSKYWNEYIHHLLEQSFQITRHYRKLYRNRVLQRFKTNIFSHCIKGKDWTVSLYKDCGLSHLQQAQIQLRKSYSQLWSEQFPIQSLQYFPSPSKSPKIFQQSYTISPNYTMLPQPILHIFILVHGFGATHRDFYYVKNYLLGREEPTEVYMSVVNEGRTSSSIEGLGARLAVQVADFMNSRRSKSGYRLSFIGHSLGGIVVKEALRHLEKFWPYLYTYISFSSPHLGYLNVSSKLINAGLWYLNNWQKCDSIRQLMMKDTQDPLKSFMFKLSQSDVLKHFKNVALVSSIQDGFVAHQSARIQKSNQLIHNSTRGNRNAAVLCRMADNILSPNIQNLYRIDVVFAIDDKSLDTLLGRIGHIKFLSDSQFLKIFINTFEHLFK